MDRFAQEILHRLNNSEDTFNARESLAQLQELLRTCQDLSGSNLRLWEDRIRCAMQHTDRGIATELPHGFVLMRMLPETRDAMDHFNQIGRRMALAFDLEEAECETRVDHNAIIAPWLRFALNGTMTDPSLINRARRTFIEYFSALQRLITPVLNATRRSIWRDEMPIPQVRTNEEESVNIDELIAVDHGGGVDLERRLDNERIGSMHAESSAARSEG